jgi:hypothetical protein
MDIEACFPLVEFLSGDLVLMTEGLHSVEDFGAFGDFAVREELPMAILRVRFDFLLHGFNESCSIGLLHGKPIVERVWIT